jgi:uncharacterized protein
VRFVDTSYWVAFSRARERHHEAARRIWLADAGPLVTSNLVVGETWTFINRRDGHDRATTFLDLIDRSPRIGVHAVTPNVEEDAWAWLRRHDERAYSFVDGTSFELMRQLRLREALAFDGDFSAAGYVEVRPP